MFCPTEKKRTVSTAAVRSLAPSRLSMSTAGSTSVGPASTTSCRLGGDGEMPAVRSRVLNFRTSAVLATPSRAPRSRVSVCCICHPCEYLQLLKIICLFTKSFTLRHEIFLEAAPTRAPTPAPSTCGCESCTAEVLATAACDESGCFSCEGRLNWLMNDTSGPRLSERDACIHLAWNEFPNGPCGPACDPTRCNDTPQPTDAPTDTPTDKPTDAPTPSPTAAPTPIPTSAPSAPPMGSPVACSCASCTQEVLDTYAGQYKCGSRIDWLRSPDGGSYSELGACSNVAGEFPNECGPCDPTTCNPGEFVPFICYSITYTSYFRLASCL